MKIKKKIIIVFCLVALLFLASLGGTILYYYYNPLAIKSIIEKAVSRSTGTSFRIKTLSYSLKPPKIRAKGIIFRPLENQTGPYLEISDLDADIALEGPFGHKTLTFKNFKIHAFSFQLYEKVALPKITQKEKRPSFFSQIFRGAMALFLFKDISFQAAEVINGDIVARFEDQTVQIKGIHAKLNSDQRIGVSGSIQLEWPSQNALFTAPDVHVSTDDAVSLVDPEIRGMLTARNATFHSPEANVKRMGAKVRISYSHKQKRLGFETMDLQLEGVCLRQRPEMDFPHLNLRLRTKGVLNTHDRKLNASSLDLNLHDTLYLKGTLDMGFGDQTDFRFQVLDCDFLPQKLLALLPDGVKRTLAPVTLSGPINLHGDMSGLRDQQKWSFHCDLQAPLKQNQFSYTRGQLQLSGKISGNIRAKGKLPDINILVRLEGDETVLSGVGIQPEPFKVGLYLSGKHPVYLIKDLKVHIPRAKMGLGKRDILIDDIRVQIQKGKMDGRGRSLFLPEIRLDSSLLTNLLMTLELSGGQLALKLQGRDVNLIESALALKLLPSGWQLSGHDSLQMSAVLNEKEDWTFTSKLGFKGVGFQNQDASYMGEKISLDIKTDGKLNLGNSHIDAKTTLSAYGGELLYDRFYLDLNSNGFFSSFEGDYDISQKFLQLSSLGFGLTDILTLAMNGTLHLKAPNPRVHLSVNIPKTSLKPIFHHFLFEPFKTENPFLAALDLGGDISANLKLIGTTSEWMVKGHCRWHEGQLSSGDSSFSFSGIDLDLPVWHQNFITPTLPSPLPATSSAESKGKGLARPPRLSESDGGQGEGAKEETLQGILSIQSLALLLLPKQPVRIPFDATPNQLSVRSPTIFRVPGGKIELGPVVCRDVFSVQPSIETSLTLEALELGPLLSGIWSRPVEGTIEGKLNPIRFEGNSVETHGELRAKVFGGDILISGLGASGIFTSTPLFKLDARWNDLRLGNLTKDTSFGKIEGILKGYINDLEIAYGQPQKFDLLFETVKRRGVPQKISVRAVENIARIGGGSSPFMGLAGAFASIFQEFPYNKIGIHASLENDVFRINGTIREDGQEYLVKRGGFSGVNVVNQNPNNRIRFKDMVKRIERVTSSETGPVVK